MALDLRNQLKKFAKVPKLTPRQIYGELQGLDLHGVLMLPHVWLSVSENERAELNALCVGFTDGGPKTAQFVQEILQQNSFGKTSKDNEKKYGVKLSLQEGLFLMDKLKCLALLDFESKQIMEVSQLWSMCLKSRGDSFLTSYAIYQHYRSLGWLLRAGIQYGGEYVLYQGHPAWFHSDYIVLPLVLSPHNAQISWRQIQLGQRLSSNVRKKLLLVYVFIPPDIDATDLSCIEQIKIEEVEASRWVPVEYQQPS
eukprot:TRINITY_DN6073_c0_g1_i4.p1 TRINITY_DN6073_c0_g1~~TRINITY_DN6073_c0_g1_i4.p1  ORF type:complete len:274 (-),score=26.32 TRINITY_DN6073_c0_g1_i4:14-775(-)